MLDHSKHLRFWLDLRVASARYTNDSWKLLGHGPFGAAAIDRSPRRRTTSNALNQSATKNNSGTRHSDLGKRERPETENEETFLPKQQLKDTSLQKTLTVISCEQHNEILDIK